MQLWAVCWYSQGVRDWILMPHVHSFNESWFVDVLRLLCLWRNVLSDISSILETAFRWWSAQRFLQGRLVVSRTRECCDTGREVLQDSLKSLVQINLVPLMACVYASSCPQMSQPSRCSPIHWNKGQTIVSSLFWLWVSVWCWKTVEIKCFNAKNRRTPPRKLAASILWLPSS